MADSFMSKNIVYFDLETQKSAADVGGWDKKRDMKMSIGVIFSTATQSYEIFVEGAIVRSTKPRQRRY